MYRKNLKLPGGGGAVGEGEGDGGGITKAGEDA